ncbi:MAG: T9SS type A sorting domain-containing protein [candidate division Zixibacteria bacterium]|nr:T9SS type A sorting domain-containing protein [candidate division Zixibacteria bacterium]
MRRFVFYLLLIFILLVVVNAASAQHYTDWTGFEYSPELYDSYGHVVYYELKKDYTICLAEYFEDSEKLPDCCEDKAEFYQAWVRGLPLINWDFIKIEFGGMLTIKKGYRWDGASYLCKQWTGDLYCPDQHHNFRSSLVHDALYDLMRMGYIKADHHHQVPIDGNCVDTHILWDSGDDNRRFADMIHYMIAIEDGDLKDDAQSDYFWLRVWGACASHDNDKLTGWKYHVNELVAYPSDGNIELEWNRPNEAGEDPDFTGHFNPHLGYSIQRDGHEIATVNPWTVTSYTDTTAEYGVFYTYQIRPIAGNENQEDWSNYRNIVMVEGAGNAYKLDGIDDYLEANTVANDILNIPPPFPYEISYEAWVYPENKSGAVVAFSSITGSKIYTLYYDAGAQKFCHYDTPNENIHSTDIFPANNWYHVAVTISTLGMRGILYVNGQQQATFVAPTGLLSFGARFSIGQYWVNDQTSLHFQGMIDEVRVWKVERTQAEIQDAMYIPLRGDEDGLVGLWHFDMSHTATFGWALDATVHCSIGKLMGLGSSGQLPRCISGAMRQPTDVDDDVLGNLIPRNFELAQNYPNPFNPATEIKYSVPSRSQVNIEVFNILGRKIRTLVDESKSAGEYRVTWDGNDSNGQNVSTGIYFYRIQAGDFVESKKMLLLK